jgi:malate/lactate dehydrogenase
MVKAGQITYNRAKAAGGKFLSNLCTTHMKYLKQRHVSCIDVIILTTGMPRMPRMPRTDMQQQHWHDVQQ